MGPAISDEVVPFSLVQMFCLMGGMNGTLLPLFWFGNCILLGNRPTCSPLCFTTTGLFSLGAGTVGPRLMGIRVGLATGGGVGKLEMLSIGGNLGGGTKLSCSILWE